MRALLRLIVFGILGALALAACSSAVETTGTRDGAAASNGVAGTGGDIFTEASELFPAQNLALIGNTGKPQFLNAFADW